MRVKKLGILWRAVVLTQFSAVAVGAQAPDPSLLTLERIFASREFASERFGPARWLEDGSGYTTLDFARSGARAFDIVRYDPETGASEVLVAAESLRPTGAASPLVVEGYDWSADGSKLLLFTNTRRVWRDNTRGDYWVFDLEDGGLRQLGGNAEEATLMFAKFSPQGDRVGYVNQNDLYVERLSDGSITRLTDNGSATMINGTFDWAYEEEFGIQDGFRWSPDGERIAFWQLNSEGVRNFLLLNNTDSLYPQLTSIPYPKVGQVLSSARVGVISAAGGPVRWMDVPGDPRNNYIARMDWAANSDEIVLQHLNRAQNTNDVMLADATTGAVLTVLTDRDEAWVDVVDDLRWIDGGARFTWVSEKNGWRHVYSVSRSGGESSITPWPLDVISVELIDQDGGWLYFMASPDNPTQRYLYRSRLDGSGEPERLTPESDAGTNRYQLSNDGRWAFQTHSSFEVPSTVRLVSLPDHRVVRTLVANSRLKAAVDGLARGGVEFYRVDSGDGVQLDGWLMKPPGFNPSRKYPLLFYVYGEPAGQTVVDRWGGSRYLWHLMLAQQGYLVASVDNRGTPAPRGREWRKIVYGDIGTLASQDQAAANRAIREWPFVDADRIGIWGWSGGGSMTLNMLFRYPELYGTGMAVAPVPDQLYYDAIYQERYSGTLEEYASGYRSGSPITYVDGLRGNLLLIHGTGDDNVHYQGSEALINAMIERNKVFTMMAYPNRSHGIFEGRGTTLHLFSLLTRYLKEHMAPGVAPTP